MKKALIGKSLSFCVRDVVKGDVSIDDVVCIITNTQFDTIDEAFSYYRDSYWRFCDPTNLKEILTQLWPRIMQPRYWGINVNIAHGYWIDTNVEGDEL